MIKWFRSCYLRSFLQTNTVSLFPYGSTCICGSVSKSRQEIVSHWLTNTPLLCQYTDPFSGNSIGGYSNLATVDLETKTRSYAGSAHGVPARQRPNVKIVTGAKTQKILFTKTGSGAAKATGVQVLIDGKVQTFTPKKEVILAAGVFNTPKVRFSGGMPQYIGEICCLL